MTAAGKPMARYDDWADWYERYTNGEARGFTQRASDALAGVLGPGTGTVLDLACGTGTHARVLADLGWAPFGLDLSMAQLRYACGRMPVIAALGPLILRGRVPHLRLADRAANDPDATSSHREGQAVSD